MPIAVETFKQALLTSLTNDYATSAVVQVPADVVVAGALESEVAGHEGESIPARFYGAVSTNKPDPQTTPYTISSAFLPLPNGASTQYPTFVVWAKHPKAQADLNLRLFYDIAFLERDFLTLEGHYGHIPSSWVTFALPPAKTAPDDDHPTLGPPMGEVDPIALRSYPQTPTLFKHAATADTGDDPLAHLEWDYQATVSTLRGVAQEELWLELTFNDLVDAPDRDDAEAGEQPSTDLATRGDRERPPPADLFAALGRFVWEYPQIEASLETIPAQAYQESPDPGSDLALRRMAALIAGVKDTIEPWSDPAHVETRARARAEASNPHPSVPHFSWRYKIEPETGSDGNPTRNLKTTRFADDTGALPAWPDIAGYSPPAGSDTTGIYTLSNEEPARWELAWKGLYLMTHQSARVSAWIERNDDLSEDPDLVTNPAFIYKTPIVTFASPLVPLVDYEQTLTPPPEHSFHAALSHVFDAFRHTDLQDRAASELKFALEASYGHVVAERGGGNTLTAQAPIFLVHGDLATQPNGAGPGRQTVAEFVHSAAGRLAAWHDAEHPNPKGAFVSLRFTAFATVARGERPLAIFREIQLPVGASAEWWAAPS